MGGLVARWYLEKLEGWQHTRSLISFGTPYRGSLNAVQSLHKGIQKKVGPFSVVDLTNALRSFASVHELLPIYRCVDPGDGKLVRLSETKIPHIDPTRVAEALRFHHEIRDAVVGHQEDPRYALQGYRIHPISGIEQPTSQSVRIRDERVELLETWDGKDLSGDGTVPRVSAVPLELGDARAGMFAGEKRASLQNDSAVLTHLRGILTGQVVDLSMFESMEPARIGVSVDELFAVGEPIPLLVRADRDDLSLIARVFNADTGEVARAVELSASSDCTYRAELAPLKEGCYRLVVEGGIDTVTSLVSVLC